MLAKMLLGMIVLVAASGAGPIPVRNLERGDPPGQTSAEKGAARLLQAFKANDPGLASDFFFPAEAFDHVKDIPVPGRYHRKLVRWYNEDISRQRARFARDDWQFDKLEMGRCKWKEPGTEGNKVAYWSCRRNFVTARAGEKTRRFEIRVLINWGDHWYVTHLGPIRK